MRVIHEILKVLFADVSVAKSTKLFKRIRWCDLYTSQATIPIPGSEIHGRVQDRLLRDLELNNQLYEDFG